MTCSSGVIDIITDPGYIELLTNIFGYNDVENISYTSYWDLLL